MVMEQESAQYLMWIKRKNIMGLCIQATTMMMKPPLYDSWEEKAFAEDSAGLLGGSSCIWPPRSYSCSFCRREFRSAQALGGHMNIHRRDRARLKQSISPQNHDQANLDFNDLRRDDHFGYKNGNHIPYCSPSMSTSSTLENLKASYLCPQFTRKDEKNCKKKEIVEMGHVDTDLSIGMNLLVQRNYQSIGLAKEDQNELVSCKRHKTSCLLIPSTAEELDLELRLGYPLPKPVK